MCYLGNAERYEDLLLGVIQVDLRQRSPHLLLSKFNIKLVTLKFYILFLSLCCYTATFAQLPATQLYSFDVRIADDAITLTNARYLSAFNENGYNNQPSFINNNELLITSNYFDATQTDILRLHLAKQTITRVTATSEGEYSPTLMPDRRHFSVIKETVGGEINQLLWKYPLSQAHGGNVIIEDEYRVGYHCWLSGSEVATFLVDDPTQLVIHDISDGTRARIADQPGRSLLNIDDQLYYADKSSADQWVIRSYDPNTNHLSPIATTLPQSEDMVFVEPGYLLMGSGSKLYRLDLRDPANWVEIADLEKYGIKKISRLAYRRNQLIVVNAK